MPLNLSKSDDPPPTRAAGRPLTDKAAFYCPGCAGVIQVDRIVTLGGGRPDGDWTPGESATCPSCQTELMVRFTKDYHLTAIQAEFPPQEHQGDKTCAR